MWFIVAKQKGERERVLYLKVNIQEFDAMESIAKDTLICPIEEVS